MCDSGLDALGRAKQDRQVAFELVGAAGRQHDAEPADDAAVSLEVRNRQGAGAEANLLRGEREPLHADLLDLPAELLVVGLREGGAGDQRAAEHGVLHPVLLECQDGAPHGGGVHGQPAADPGGLRHTPGAVDAVDVKHVGPVADGQMRGLLGEAGEVLQVGGGPRRAAAAPRAGRVPRGAGRSGCGRGYPAARRPTLRARRAGGARCSVAARSRRRSRRATAVRRSARRRRGCSAPATSRIARVRMSDQPRSPLETLDRLLSLRAFRSVRRGAAPPFCCPLKSPHVRQIAFRITWRV